jgi:quinol monooxygenase YgiN
MIDLCWVAGEFNGLPRPSLDRRSLNKRLAEISHWESSDVISIFTTAPHFLQLFTTAPDLLHPPTQQLLNAGK